jgi:hypothetical protein
VRHGAQNASANHKLAKVVPPEAFNEIRNLQVSDSDI